MAEPTLIQVFGASATQDADFLTIAKADLAAVGLTTGTSNDAEKLLTAIIKLASQNLTTTARDGDENTTLNPDQNIAIELSEIPSFVSRDDGNGTFETFIRDTYTIQLDKAYNAMGIDPDDY
jgi:hypothetical protein